MAVRVPHSKIRSGDRMRVAKGIRQKRSGANLWQGKIDRSIKGNQTLRTHIAVAPARPSEGSRQFKSNSLRHTVCSASLQSGVSGKSPRDAGLVRLMRIGERESCTRFGEFLGFVSRRRKAGSL